MNSSYVETDEEQRRWLSTFAYDHAATFGTSIVGFGHLETQNRLVGCLEYPSAHIDGSHPHANVAPETYHQLTLTNPWLETKPHQLGAEYIGCSTPAWMPSQADSPPTVAFPVSCEYQHTSQQGYSFQDLQAPLPVGYVTSSSTCQDNSGPLLRFNGADLQQPSNNLEPAQSPHIIEQRRFDPPLVPCVDGAMPRQQLPRFVGDEYAASWIRGTGVERVGWCGFCPTWHRLKDSAYWYHVCKLQ